MASGEYSTHVLLVVVLWFDPKRQMVSYLIRPAKNVIGLEAVVPFDGSLVVG